MSVSVPLANQFVSQINEILCRMRKNVYLRKLLINSTLIKHTPFIGTLQSESDIFYQPNSLFPFIQNEA